MTALTRSTADDLEVRDASAKRTATPTKIAPRARYTSGDMDFSDLDLDDFADHEPAGHDQTDSECDQPDGRVEQRVHIGRIRHRDEDQEPHRHHRKNAARQAALGCEPSDQALDLEPLTHGLSHEVEHLGGVAAGLALQ